MNPIDHNSDSIQIHECHHIGLTMDGLHVEEIHNAHGQHYWKATAKIGTIFGFEVDGECQGIGRTREEALERLKKDQDNLAESIWA